MLVSDCYFPVERRGDRESAATQYIFVEALGYCRLLGLAEELSLIEQAGLDVTHVEDLTRHYVLTLERWIENVRTNRRRIEDTRPGLLGGPAAIHDDRAPQLRPPHGARVHGPRDEGGAPSRSRHLVQHAGSAS